MAKETFPAKYAEFFSNSEPGEPAHELLVVDRRTRFKDGVIKGTSSVQYRQYRGSLGAMSSGWMKEDRSTAAPEGIFAFLYLDRLKERELIRSALIEFGKIDECDWARKMVKALDELAGIDHGQD